MDQEIKALQEAIEGLEKQKDAKIKEIDDFMSGFEDGSNWNEKADLQAKDMQKSLAEIQTQIDQKDRELEQKVNFQKLQSERRERERKADKNWVAANKISEKQDLMNRYSLAKAVQEAGKQKVLSGAEGELHQETENYAKEKGFMAPGENHIMLPINLNELRGEKQIEREKAMSVGTPTTGGAGVSTTTMPLVPVLKPRLRVVEAGTQVRPGMVGNLSFYRHTTVETASMNTEIGAGNEVTPAFDTFAASPHRIECYTTISKQLMIQNPEVGEPWVRQNLEFAQQKKLDQQVLDGTGIAPEIEGLSAISGVNSVSWDSLDPYASMIAMETAIAEDNADVDGMKYLITPGLRGTLKTTRIDPGAGIMVWDRMPYEALVSTQVPINTTPEPDEHYVYHGNWMDGSLFLWGIVDIVVDPYSLRRTAQLEVVVNIWADYALNHPQSMALMTDAVL